MGENWKPVEKQVQKIVVSRGVQIAKENLQEDIFGGSKKFNKTFFQSEGNRC